MEMREIQGIIKAVNCRRVVLDGVWVDDRIGGYEEGVGGRYRKDRIRKKKRTVSDEDGEEDGEEVEEDDIEGYRRRKGGLIQRKRILLRC